MQYFTGLQYIKIDIANQYGLDKLTWQERLDWVDQYSAQTLYEHTEEAKEPILYYKAVNALHDALNGLPTGFIMGLDATASGLQIMACLMGCHRTAQSTNLIYTNKRQDVYQLVADIMDPLVDQDITKDIVKHPVMTTFYGSKQQPKNVFGSGTKELKKFYEVLKGLLPGALECMDDIQGCWQSHKKEHAWTLPDGHRAIVPVMVQVDKKIEIDELDHRTFTHRSYINEPAKKGLSLAANIVHSIDGYVVRESIRRAHLQGFELLTIHDSFWASPNHMNNVRQNYLDILIEIADSEILQHILREVTESDIILDKVSNDLPQQMHDAEYALS